MDAQKLANLKDEYRDAAVHTLGGFQLLEEGLKTYIEVYYTVVHELLQGKLHFGFKAEDIQEAPLGRLINVFSKMCADHKLVTELRALIKHRDKVAHQAFKYLYGEGPGADALIVMTEENVKLGTQLSTLLPRVHTETLAVFEAVPEAKGDVPGA